MASSDKRALDKRVIDTAAALTAELEQRIASGELLPGQRLTPVRDAARQLELAPNTVSRAYRSLADRGLVFGQGRLGTFVADRPNALGRIDESTPEGLTDLANGNPDPSLLPDLSAALQRVADRHGATSQVAYGEPAIDDTLAAVLIADLQPDLHFVDDGFLTQGETLAVVGGALDGIERTLMAHLRPGDRVGVEDPAYSSVLNLISALNLRPVSFEIDEQGPVPDALERALASGVEAVVITPRAQNPTGAAMSVDRSVAVAEILGCHPSILVIEDDHASWVAGVPYHSAIPRHFPHQTAHWVVVRSVAKSLGPDLRLAAIAGDSTTISRVAGRQMLGTGWVSYILQRTVAELLTMPETASTLAEASDAYAVRRDSFIGRLRELEVDCHGSSGLNVWVPVEDEASVVVGMQRRGFAIRSGARYRQQSGPAVRVSTAASDVATLQRAADALAEVLRGGTPTRSA